MKQTRDYILSEIKKTLQTIAPDAKAMLFGSRARNDAREDSDWEKRSFTIFHKNVEEEGIAI